MIVAEMIESSATAAAAARVSLEQPIASDRNKPSSQSEPAPKRAKNSGAKAPSTGAPDLHAMSHEQPVGHHDQAVQIRDVPVVQSLPTSADQQQANASSVAPRPSVQRVVGQGDSSINSTHRNEANAATAPHVPLAAPSGSGWPFVRVVDEIEMEVRELLDDKLFGKDDAAKVEALRKLAVYFQQKDGGTTAVAEKMMEGRMAVSNFGGCHLVMIALRQELDKDGGPNRNVVLKAIQFLQAWNDCPNRRRITSQFNGIGKIVRAMEAFPNDEAIQLAALVCFDNFSNDRDDDSTRRLELFEENCFRCIVRAAMTSALDARTQELASRLINRVCEIEGRSYRD
jgi:hypothetical protein